MQGFSDDRTSGADTRNIVASLPEEIREKVTSELASAPTKMSFDQMPTTKPVLQTTVPVKISQQPASSSTVPASSFDRIQTSEDASRESMVEKAVEQAREKQISVHLHPNIFSSNRT